MTAAIEIGGRRIGDGHRAMIVAEMSANHNGSLETALAIVDAAAHSGADAIKLQTYTPGTLTLDSTRAEFFVNDPASLWHGRRLWDLYQEAQTPWEWHAPVFRAARAAGLACISTAYDVSSLEFLLSLDVDAVKIASFELVHLPLIAAAARSGKPLLVSTGMATEREIAAAVSAIGNNRGKAPVLLKCTSAYPSDEADANVLTMVDMRARYGLEVGLSDHTLRPYAAFAAVALGACVVEKHFTLAREDGGVDAAFSLEPRELRELADGCEAVWRCRGTISYGARESERTSLTERPSIYVVRAMKKGETFSGGNVRVVRPANGLAPGSYDWIIGKTCTRDLDANEPLSWELVSARPTDPE